MFEAVLAFRKKLASGQVGVGCGITLTDPSVIEALGTRPDFYWIDLEHTPLDYQALMTHFIAVRTTARPALVRVRGSDVPSIKTVLDTGADGIIVPQIESADEVRRVVEATRYSPLGKRALGHAVLLCTATKTHSSTPVGPIRNCSSPYKLRMSRRWRGWTKSLPSRVSIRS